MHVDIKGSLRGTARGDLASEVMKSCVHCGMCNATCPTFELTGDELDGPRGRIYLIKQALEGEPVSALTQHHLDRCLSCRACETTCPSGVRYHALLDIGRELVAEHVQRPRIDRIGRFAIRRLTSRPWALRALIQVGRLLTAVLPETLKAKIPGKVAMRPTPLSAFARRMTLLRGCAQRAAAPHINQANQRVFAAVGVTLDEDPQIGCCGALDFHLDAVGQARARIKRNIDILVARLDRGDEAIIINASGCAAFIRDYPAILADDAPYAAKARRVSEALRDPVEILRETPPTPVRKPSREPIAVHTPCTLRNGTGLADAPAALLKRLGYNTVAGGEPHMCCGSAGAYSLLQPKMANQLRDRKLAILNDGTPAMIVTANIGCWLHLGGASAAPVRHWLEAVDDLI